MIGAGGYTYMIIDQSIDFRNETNNICTDIMILYKTALTSRKQNEEPKKPQGKQDNL